jgi:menaquinone-dependent protoporphyrinogen IX oxidase
LNRLIHFREVTVSGGTLVAYASKGGATETYALLIAEMLKVRGLEVDVADLLKAEVGDLVSYGNVVVGAGVRIGLVYRKARKFLKRKDLAGRRLAVFLSTGMTVEDPEKAGKKYVEPLIAKFGLEPVMTGSFPGVMPGQGGKHQDKTDPEAAGRWAEELASRLGAGS